MAFAPCALSCDSGPEPPINTGVVRTGNEDVKRFTAQGQAWPADQSRRAAELPPLPPSAGHSVTRMWIVTVWIALRHHIALLYLE